MTDERNGGRGRHVEVDPMQDLGPTAVREVDVVEADVTLDLREWLGAWVIDDLRLLVEHADDLVQRGCGREERVVEL